MKKIGVVVTVYNLEQYIEQCIKSIMNQTYSNIQIVVVDDGSTDRSGKICDCLAKEDHRISVLHQKNQGPIMSRLNGVKKISADFVTFVDGDDWIDLDLYQDIIDSQYLDKAEIVCFGIKRYNNPNDIYEESSIFNQGFYDKEAIIQYISKGLVWNLETLKYGLEPSLCTKIFKRNSLKKHLEIIKDLHIHYGEDAAIFYPMIIEAESIAIIKKCYYNHRKRTNNKVPSYIQDEKYFEKVFKLYRYLHKSFSGNICSNELLHQLDYFYMYSVELKKIKYGDLAIEDGHIFPYEKVKKNSDIVLYGAGRVGQIYYKQLKKTKYCQVVGWVDKAAEIYKKKQIQSIDKLGIMKYDFIVIAIEAENTSMFVKDYLINMGIDASKIVTI